MTNEPQWWHHPKYWPEQDQNSDDVSMPKIDEIVAEAERRGKRMAWEEAKELIDKEPLPVMHESYSLRDKILVEQYIALHEGHIYRAIDAKLTSLKKV